MFYSSGFLSFTPIVKEQQNKQKTNSLCMNCTVHHQLCLLSQLAEIYHTLLLQIWPGKTNNHLSAEKSLLSAEKPASIQRMKSMIMVLTMVEKTLPTGRITLATVLINTWVQAKAKTWAQVSAKTWVVVWLRSRGIVWATTWMIVWVTS